MTRTLDHDRHRTFLRTEGPASAATPLFGCQAEPALQPRVAVALIAGAALGASGTRLAQNWQPRSVMLLQPAPIDKMAERSPVAIKGDVAEVFGNKFVVQDRRRACAWSIAGPRGEDRAVVARGETVTVQGLFDRRRGACRHARPR